ncbi:MAG: hypothetical protein LLH30_16180 [Candidatus Manganitrophus sp. SA1]|nr:hypothetical protein [Candidatus Manganitrophus morganii]
MPLLLRKIKKTRWAKIKASWLGADDVHADSVSDLQTKGNTLSVWQIDDDKSNLNQILTALAARFQKVPIGHLEYVLFDQNLLSEIDIKFNQSKAETPDDRANVCHYNLIELSGAKLNRLAKIIIEYGEIDICLSKDLTQSLAKAIESKQIERKKINEDILAEVDKIIGKKENPNPPLF